MPKSLLSKEKKQKPELQTVKLFCEDLSLCLTLSTYTDMPIKVRDETGRPVWEVCWMQLGTRKKKTEEGNEV